MVKERDGGEDGRQIIVQSELVLTFFLSHYSSSGNGNRFNSQREINLHEGRGRTAEKKKTQGGGLQNYHVDAKERKQYEGN